MRYWIVCLLVFIGITGFTDTAPKTISNFSLINTDGKSVSLSDFKEAKGFMVVFTCNHCPFARLYTARLNALSKKYAAQGVPLIAINAMDTLLYDDENLVAMSQRAKSEQFDFPYLSDGSQQVGKMFDAKHTPQAFIIWKEGEQWVVKYNGAIDDNGQEPEKARSYLGEAANLLLQGKPVSFNKTASFGCAIHYRKK
jgi:peroxiredoxin